MMCMCEKTGKWLYDDDAIEQSIRRILRTPKGSMVMNRTFGSRLFEFIDQPANEILPHISHEIFRSLMEFIPEFKIKAIHFTNLQVEIIGAYAGKTQSSKFRLPT